MHQMPPNVQQYNLFRTSFRVYAPYGLLLFSSALVWGLMFVLTRDQQQYSSNLLLYGEVLVAPIVGCMATTLWMSDSCREILMTMSISSQALISVRIAVIWFYASLSWGGLCLLAVYSVDQPIVSSISYIRLFVGGLTSITFGLLLGSSLAILLRSTINACLGVIALWGLAIVFRINLLQSMFGTLIHPFLTYDDPLNSLWIVNRSVLLSIGILLLGASFLRLQREERFIVDSSAENVL